MKVQSYKKLNRDSVYIYDQCAKIRLEIKKIFKK